MEEAICKWCDEVFEYEWGTEITQGDEDYDGNYYQYDAVECPNCGSMTKV